MVIFKQNAHVISLYSKEGWLRTVLWDYIYPWYVSPLFPSFCVESSNSLLYIVGPVDNGGLSSYTAPFIKRKDPLYCEKKPMNGVFVVLIRPSTRSSNPHSIIHTLGYFLYRDRSHTVSFALYRFHFGAIITALNGFSIEANSIYNERKFFA